MCEYWLQCLVACEKPDCASKHCWLSGFSMPYLAVSKGLCGEGFFSSFTSYHLLKTYSSLAFTYLTLSQADSILAKRRCYEGQYSIWNSLNLVISEDPLNIFWKKQGIVIAAVEYTWEGKHLTSWLTCTNMSPQMQDALVLELLCIPALIRPSVSFM